MARAIACWGCGLRNTITGTRGPAAVAACRAAAPAARAVAWAVPGTMLTRTVAPATSATDADGRNRALLRMLPPLRSPAPPWRRRGVYGGGGSFTRDRPRARAGVVAHSGGT